MRKCTQSSRILDLKIEILNFLRPPDASTRPRETPPTEALLFSDHQIGADRQVLEFFRMLTYGPEITRGLS
jgi:hypothetical protein